MYKEVLEVVLVEEENWALVVFPEGKETPRLPVDRLGVNAFTLESHNKAETATV
jgi:hypothetical protein